MIELGNDLPGILGPMAFSPHTAEPLNALADALLGKFSDAYTGGDAFSGLSRYERELIAAYVSYRNRCEFCFKSHAAFAAEVGGYMIADVERTVASPGTWKGRTTAILRVAEGVRSNTAPRYEIAAAQAVLSDREIHDVVLIAAAFSMFNRYVEAVGGPPATKEQYQQAAKRIAADGYRA